MQNTSPVPLRDTPKQIDFPDAIREVINGKKITRVEWKEDSYGIMKDGFLIIHRDDKDFKWIVSEADMIAEDWVVNETN
jgi:hypothetical protein